MILYEFLNKINGDGYAGITHRPFKIRKSEHLSKLRKGEHSNIRFQNAYNKYGEEAFEIIIRATFKDLESLNEAEVEFLEKEKHRLYNITPGGNGSFHHIETKNKISKTLSKPVIGMNIKTGEIKEYSSVMETEKDGFNYKNIGGACRLTKNKLSTDGYVWMYKKDFNLEEIEKRRQNASRGKIRLERSIAGKHLRTGKVIQFISGEDCKRILGIQNVTKACNFTDVKTRDGYVWVYTDVKNWQKLLEKRFILMTDGNKKNKRQGFSTIIGMEISTKKIVEFNSLQELKNSGFISGRIYEVIKGSDCGNRGSFCARKSYKKFVWAHKEETTIQELENKVNAIINCNRSNKWL